MVDMGKKNIKFSNINILEFMNQVVKKHTRHYQSDFEIDREILQEAAQRRERQDMTFVWLCRTCGTWCLLERDVFLKNTGAYNTFAFYMEQTSEPILAFVIEIMSVTAGSVMGNVYVLDYAVYYNHVCSTSLRVETIVLQYARGCRFRKADDRIGNYPDMEYGELQSIRYLPHSQEDLTEVLQKEEKERMCFQEGNPGVYLAKL